MSRPEENATGLGSKKHRCTVKARRRKYCTAKGFTEVSVTGRIGGRLTVPCLQTRRTRGGMHVYWTQRNYHPISVPDESSLEEKKRRGNKKGKRVHEKEWAKEEGRMEMGESIGAYRTRIARIPTAARIGIGTGYRAFGWMAGLKHCTARSLRYSIDAASIGFSKRAL